jgi:hypothetical protein
MCCVGDPESTTELPPVHEQLLARRPSARTRAATGLQAARLHLPTRGSHGLAQLCRPKVAVHLRATAAGGRRSDAYQGEARGAARRRGGGGRSCKERSVVRRGGEREGPMPMPMWITARETCFFFACDETCQISRVRYVDASIVERGSGQ